MSELRIDYVPLAELKRWPRNPKEHDLGTLHQSVARFGFVNPIIVNEATGYILAGHGRLNTLQQRKAAGEPVPDGLKAKGDDWLVPVVRGVELPSEEAEAYAVADNRLVETGGWDDQALTEVLSDLAANDALEGVGFDGDDLDGLLEDVALSLETSVHLFDQAVQHRPPREYVLVTCEKESEFEELARILELGRVRRGGYKLGSQFDAIGQQRVVFARALLERLRSSADSGAEQGSGGTDEE